MQTGLDLDLQNISEDMIADEGEIANDSSFIRHRNAYLDDDLGRTETN